jgi:nucleoside-diphosphate-sugar epimerase
MVFQDDRARYQLVSGERLRHELAATPQVSLDQGLGQIIAWHRSRA